MWIPAIWRLKNVVHNCQEQVLKNWFTAIIWKKKVVPSYFENTVAAIWREKKVDPCYLETKKCSSQLLGARKKIITSI